jgi:hypothetical protein
LKIGRHCVQVGSQFVERRAGSDLLIHGLRRRLEVGNACGFRHGIRLAIGWRASFDKLLAKPG